MVLFAAMAYSIKPIIPLHGKQGFAWPNLAIMWPYFPPFWALHVHPPAKPNLYSVLVLHTLPEWLPEGPQLGENPSLSQGYVGLDPGTLRGYMIQGTHLLKEKDFSNFVSGFVLKEDLILSGYKLIHSQDSPLSLLAGLRPFPLPLK